MQHRTVVIAAFEIGHAEPTGMLRPGQGHIEQTQIFRQTFVVGQGDQLGRRFQRHLSLTRRVVVMQRQTTAIHRLRRTNERQKHQGIFKPFGLVNGHDLDQLLVALQTQDLLFTGLPGQRQMLG
ncbi:hypothetical protein D3C72_1744030 [compost metagenome]